MLSHQLRLGVCVLVVTVLGCGRDERVTPPPDDDPVVVFSFTGTVVRVVYHEAVSPPPGVDVGDQVKGTFSYVGDLASKRGVEGPRADYDFAPDVANQITVEIGSQAWTVPLYWARVCDDDCGLDLFEVAGTARSAPMFPGSLGHDGIGVNYADTTAPYELVRTSDLPTSASAVNFEGAASRESEIRSTIEDRYWQIYFVLDPK